jgi:alkylated DNA repair dioxygenase AlkB
MVQNEAEAMGGRIIMATEESHLTLYNQSLDKVLIDGCIADTAGKLAEKPPIMVYGKMCRQQRNVGFFSDESSGYNYSSQKMPSQPLTPAMATLLEKVNKQLGATYNGMLVNEYLNGDDKIGAHSDDERDLDPAVGVAALSVGGGRIFRIRHKKVGPHSGFEGGKKFFDHVTGNYELMVMGGKFQKEFTHEIPEQKKVKDKRLSITFRRHAIDKKH